VNFKIASEYIIYIVIRPEKIVFNALAHPEIRIKLDISSNKKNTYLANPSEKY